jgi:hypothetical protein
MRRSHVDIYSVYHQYIVFLPIYMNRDHRVVEDVIVQYISAQTDETPQILHEVPRRT